MLAVDDSRFFDDALRRDLESFLAQRTLFDPEVLELADHTSEHGGLDDRDTARFLDLAVATFVLSDKPITEAWYWRLEQVSAVAADIGGVESTHINHLTPRVLDIDALYRAMEDRGIEMIDEVQGPPRWEGPDILLRQTSFRALSEVRTFEAADGSTAPGGLRVRFGEVEQRGIAVTPAGRRLYDEMTSEVERLVSEPGQPERKPEIAEQVWRDRLPATEAGLAEAELGYFTYEAAPDAKGGTTAGMSLAEAVERGAVRRVPIVYEDFLPKSAAGTRRRQARAPRVIPPSCDELSQDDLDRIEREEQVDTDAPIVLETGDGKINAAEAAVMAFFLAIGGQEMVENMLDIKREADGAGEEAYPDQGLDQQEDAFRHAYWNASMTQDHSEKAAEMLANAHETHKDPTPLDDKREAMDLHNNEVGRRIAMQHPDASPEELKKHIDEAVRCGEMVCIDEDGNLQPSNYNL